MFQVVQPSHPLNEDEPDSYDKVDATTNVVIRFAAVAQVVPSHTMWIPSNGLYYKGS